jgi:sugar lactone lactonase YvrE
MSNRINETGGTPMGKEAATSADFNNSFTSAVSATGNLIAEQAYKNVVVSANYENEGSIAAENYSVAAGAKETVDLGDTTATFNTDKYELDPTFDVSAVGFSGGKNFSFQTQFFVPNNVSFKPDGTKMYGLGGSPDTIYQYTLSTPFDVTSASYDSKSVNVSTEDSQMNSMSFKPDGTKVYLCGTANNKIYQYTLSTPWDISTATYDSVSFDTSTQDTDPQGVFLKDDGLKMYVMGDSNNTVFQYTLGTAWVVSSATYDSVSFSIATQEVNPTDLFFKSDGTEMYVTGTQVNSNVYRYTLSTAWDVSSATHTSTFNIDSEDSLANSVFFKSNGAKMYIAGGSSSRVYQYSLSEPFDILTASYNDSISVTSEDTAPFGLFFKSDGTKMYTTGGTNNKVYQYTLSVPFSVPSATYDSKSFDITTQDTGIGNVFLKPDGTKMYVVGNTNKNVYQYTLVTPYDVSTATYDSVSFSVATEITFPLSVVFKDDGLKMYVNGFANTIFQYSLSSAWDVSTATYDSKSLDIIAQDGISLGFYLKSDGTKIYVTGDDNNKVYQYTMSTPYDLSTATYDSKSFDITTQDTGIGGIFFKPSGDKMYVVGNQNDSVYEYSVGSFVLCSNNTLAVDDETNSFALYWKGDFDTGNTGTFILTDGTNEVELPVNSTTKHTGAIVVDSLSNIDNVSIKQKSNGTSVTSTNGWGISKL